jgi:RNA polymerase sigma-70 factor (ECF subfamily)
MESTDVPRATPSRGLVPEFEDLYRSTFRSLTGYFGRRVSEPQVVADLTAETFAEAMTSFATFDPRKGSSRAWIFGIARRVFAQYVNGVRRDADRAERLAHRRSLQPDEIEELAARVDAERTGRDLLARLEDLGKGERDVLELVVLSALTSREAGDVLGISAGAARVRLHRAKTTLRQDGRHP